MKNNILFVVLTDIIQCSGIIVVIMINEYLFVLLTVDCVQSRGIIIATMIFCVCLTTDGVQRMGINIAIMINQYFVCFSPNRQHSK